MEGPQKGKRLERIASMITDWGHWLMLHPESTAYDLFDGKKYQVGVIPTEMTPEAQQTMGPVDGRLPPLANVIGVETGGETEAFPLDAAGERACFTETIGGEPIAVLNRPEKIGTKELLCRIAHSSTLHNRSEKSESKEIRKV